MAAGRAPLSPLVGAVVCPGDSVGSLTALAAAAGGGPAGAAPTVRLGASLLQSEGEVRATRAGRLRQTGGGKLWVETNQRRYLPAVDDAVVGVVAERHAEARAGRGEAAGRLTWCPELRGGRRRPVPGGPARAGVRERHPPQPARVAAPRHRLPGLSLRSPALVVGSLVYARVEAAPRDADPQLTCVDGSGKAAGMGPLLGGLPFELPTGAARCLLARPPPPALAALGAALAFELVVGVNGRCWVAATDCATCVLVAAALRDGAARPEQAEALVAAMLAVHAQGRT